MFRQDEEEELFCNLILFLYSLFISLSSPILLFPCITRQHISYYSLIVASFFLSGSFFLHSSYLLLSLSILLCLFLNHSVLVVFTLPFLLLLLFLTAWAPKHLLLTITHISYSIYIFRNRKDIQITWILHQI